MSWSEFAGLLKTEGSGIGDGVYARYRGDAQFSRVNRMTDQVYNVLFLCKANSTCSILAEAIMNKLGREHFRAFSAGLRPTRKVHSLALEEMRRSGLPTVACRSKSWLEFALPDARHMHFVFTVCDKVADEIRRIWPSQPITGHWSIDDPGKVVGSEEKQRHAFSQIYTQLGNRIRLLLSLPLHKIERLAQQTE